MFFWCKKNNKQVVAPTNKYEMYEEVVEYDIKRITFTIQVKGGLSFTCNQDSFIHPDNYAYRIDLTTGQESGGYENSNKYGWYVEKWIVHPRTIEFGLNTGNRVITFTDINGINVQLESFNILAITSTPIEIIGKGTVINTKCRKIGETI